MNPAAHKKAHQRAQIAREALKSCRLCPRNCGVDRTAGEVGFCDLTDAVRCFREVLYDGEEADLNPSHHICFAGCNLRCEICTVAEWNEQPESAKQTSIDDLNKIIIRRKHQGAKTLNLLGGEPAVNVYGILELLSRINPKTTVVWNSNMYYNQVVEELITGLVDVYLPDFKVGNSRCAEELFGAADYLEVVKVRIAKAVKQGRVIVRHVILPGHTECCLKPILSWIAEEIADVEVSLRGNYFPPADASKAPAGYLSREEFQNAIQLASRLRLNLVK